MYPKPPFPSQSQPMPGSNSRMDPRPDYGETTYKGSGRLAGKKAVITGADSGIGRAVAVAFAREGADVLISYLSEHDDAKDVKTLVENEGRKAVLLAGDLRNPDHCRYVIEQAVKVFGGVDILVNNAAHQATFKDIGDISDEEWETTFETNIHAMFYLAKAAVPHMKPGSAIINTASVNSDMPNPILLAYATTKGAIQNFTGGLAQMLAEKGGERGRAGADLDAADPVDDAGRGRQELWQTSSHETGRATGGARNRLRDARRPALELHVRNDGGRDGREAVHLRKSCG
jgi:NAD(P)-dependent dehydrogenase (short-subunit alcohol dehydrogenase family)